MTHKDRFDDLEATNSFTDPGGTTHSGSIPDAARTDEEIRDVVAAAMSAGAEINVTHDDPNDTITIDFAGTHYTSENARDDIAAALSGGTDISVSHDDANDTITIDYTGSGGGGGGNVVYAAPGNVQTVIDNNANPSSGRTVVKLHAQTDYDPSATWNVKNGIDLHFNGARVLLTSDIDVIHLEPGSRVYEPFINYRNVSTYTSNVFLIDAAQYGKYDEGISTSYSEWNGAEVHGGYTLGTYPEGTVFRLFADGNQNSSGHVYWVRVQNHMTFKTGTAVELEALNGNFVNSNYFETCHFLHPDVGVHTLGSDVQDNRFADCTIQPYRDNSQYGIRLEAGSHNYFDVTIWDKLGYPTGQSLVFDSGCGHGNTVVDNFKMSPENVTDNSSGNYNNWFCMNRFTFDGMHGVRFYDSSGLTSPALYRDSQSNDIVKVSDLSGTSELSLRGNGLSTFNTSGGYVEFKPQFRMQRTSSAPNGYRGCVAYSDGSWGSSGEGLYRYNGTSWVYVG